jgi:hypothetical protein
MVARICTLSALTASGTVDSAPNVRDVCAVSDQARDPCVGSRIQVFEPGAPTQLPACAAAVYTEGRLELASVVAGWDGSKEKGGLNSLSARVAQRPEDDTRHGDVAVQGFFCHNSACTDARCRPVAAHCFGRVARRAHKGHVDA